MLDISTILMPVDFSPHARLAAAHAAQLATTHNATLHLLHVLEEPSFPSFYGAGSAVMYDEPPDLEARARDALQDLAGAITDASEPPVQVHVTDGEASLMILETARSLGIDLIVIAGLGRTGLNRLLLGSVAQDVVQHAPCAVFVVKTNRSSLVAGWEPIETAAPSGAE
jgi:nucleotide-binding universal stress UspA family protein